MANRFNAFTEQERKVLHDALLSEAQIDPDEDPTFPPIVATAEALIIELEEIN